MAKPDKNKNKNKASTKPAATAVVEPDEELEELEEGEATDTAPASGGAQQTVTFGASDLAKHLSKGRDKPVSAREIRTLLRKMARDGRIEREITPGNRTRYDWSGPNDPEVKKVIKAFNAGELDADKAEKLQALKDRKAKQTAEKKAAAAKEAPAEDEADDEDVSDDDE